MFEKKFLFGSCKLRLDLPCHGVSNLAKLCYSIKGLWETERTRNHWLGKLIYKQNDINIFQNSRKCLRCKIMIFFFRKRELCGYWHDFKVLEEIDWRKYYWLPINHTHQIWSDKDRQAYKLIWYNSCIVGFRMYCWNFTLGTFAFKAFC